jgi:hypothetical protein
MKKTNSKTTIATVCLMLVATLVNAQDASDMIGVGEWYSGAWTTRSVPQGHPTWHIAPGGNSGSAYAAETDTMTPNTRADLFATVQGDGSQYLVQWAGFCLGGPNDTLRATVNGISIGEAFGGQFNWFFTQARIINSLPGNNSITFSANRYTGSTGYFTALVDSVIWVKVPPGGFPEPQLTAQIASDGTIAISWPYPSYGYTPVRSSDLVNWFPVTGYTQVLLPTMLPTYVVRASSAPGYQFYTLRRL